MRVKIAYTVDIEEIENEVKEIMNRALLGMEIAHNGANDVTNSLDTGEKDLMSLILTLDKCRRQLAKADVIMSDCQEILSGYYQVLEETAQKEANEDEEI